MGRGVGKGVGEFSFLSGLLVASAESIGDAQSQPRRTGEVYPTLKGGGTPPGHQLGTLVPNRDSSAPTLFDANVRIDFL